ncbi:hypothetical protein [Janthinobacterium agaricidamnosum]|uniref:Uncharacterized protein n=1 Tax=Janthinobacterium agaricidamnosum NBRC 102515 = DSM 9628 TaxID=1349767 RepID=W0V1H8_9BURK|nr:hypothetical protein [Janthinobacterium agaricidamnosum]CDG82684.1 hypothetical protein GJA_2049 [Janthinobacterium agaricidamnosum NBRC 102515 = DSM 9628]
MKASSAAIAATGHRRPQWRQDFASACIIDRCLEVQAAHGTYLAALLLYTNKVDLQVALRVLSSKRRRPLLADSLAVPRTYINPPPLVYCCEHY